MTMPTSEDCPVFHSIHRKYLNPDKQDSTIQLVLTSGQKGTRLYVNGRLVKEKPKMVLKVPVGDGTRLILGNSPYGRASWKGDIHSLALLSGNYFEKEIEIDIFTDDGSLCRMLM